MQRMEQRNNFENQPFSTNEVPLMEAQLNDIKQRATQSFADYSIHEYDRDDLIQETVIRLYQKIRDTEEPHTTPFEHYINRTIRRRKLDYRRKKMNRQRIFDRYAQSVKYEHTYDDKHGDPLDIVIHNEMLFAVFQEALATLTPVEYRVCQYLYQEWKPAEIAQTMDIPPKKVYNTIYRVRKKLKAALQMNVD
ncbi:MULTISPECIES: sigma-70 family RNA polymerase sigma factor [unclassified Staphylococcus]|uniref:sigma-70 family RNA polymerase sigma factor n=1 Tax=unclassified Staphylococcus TaxID=91994 RepID=UPI0021D0FDA7|nr:MULTISPECIES: sigma-70 family RNA polymerase sigma factor [unclassified Staphylococcus]UXR78556.1 sigma-70 family RNA polymerase sigma factor [Staphylococcus sp. IVB6227]UXR82713.1 sigma-70 family RNA polymerase sigma factor [Staphylococcus sp. IVB6214]